MKINSLLPRERQRKYPFNAQPQSTGKKNPQTTSSQLLPAELTERRPSAEHTVPSPARSAYNLYLPKLSPPPQKPIIQNPRRRRSTWLTLSEEDDEDDQNAVCSLSFIRARACAPKAGFRVTGYRRDSTVMSQG